MKTLRRKKYKKLKPQIPTNNYYIDIGIEDDSTPRICCSDTVDNCLTGLADTVNIGDIFYVYELDSKKIVSNKDILKNNLVPFAKYTKELWVLEECTPIETYKIRVIGKEKSKIVKQKINGKFFMRELICWRYKEEN